MPTPTCDVLDEAGHLHTAIMMVDKSYSRSSLSQYLEDAVCLLALITDRQPDLDQVPEEASKLDDDDDNAHSDGLLELEVLPDIEVDQEKLQ